MNKTENCSCEESLLEVLSKLWLSDVLFPLVCSLGVLGNLVALLVLRSPEMKSTFHQSLLTLAACDIIFLGVTLCDHYVDMTAPIYVFLFPYVWNPLKNILMTWETFLIMSISTERFFAICRPLCYRTHKLSHSSRTHLMTYSLPPILVSILVNIPKFLEFEFVTRNVTDVLNTTSLVTDYDVTDLRLDQDYIFYYTHWTRLLLTGLIPVAFLAGMNIAICVKIKATQTFSSQSQSSCVHDPRLESTSNVDQNLSQKHGYKKPKSSVATLSTIVIMYLICNSPRLSLNMAEYILSDKLYDVDSCDCSLAPSWFFILIRISHLFLVINSSSNFLIYFSVCKRFKMVLRIKIRKLIILFKHC